MDESIYNLLIAKDSIILSEFGFDGRSARLNGSIFQSSFIELKDPVKYLQQTGKSIMKVQCVTQKEIGDALETLIGFEISHVWRGHGSAVFLELGKLTASKKRNGQESLQGEFTIMVEWSWRVEKSRSIWFGAFSSVRKIDSRLPKLIGSSIKDASLKGRLPELRLTLTGGFWFESFMCEEGQPNWTIFTPSDCLFSKRKNIYKEPRDQAHKVSQNV